MRGTVAKRLRKLASALVEYKVSQSEEAPTPPVIDTAKKQSYKMLKKEYKKNSQP